MQIVWFRQDLRLQHNPALTAALEGGTTLPIYIHDASTTQPGSASSVWLHHALSSLNASLSGCLNFLTGNTETILTQLCEQYDVTTVYWNRRYEPSHIELDRQIKEALQQQGVHVVSCTAYLLTEPWQVMTKQGTSYRVFTPYYHQVLVQLSLPTMTNIEVNKHSFSPLLSHALPLDELELLPQHDWAKKCQSHWDISEQGAYAALMTFIDKGLNNYQRQRDFPALEHTSKLSPYLHFGQISPQQVISLLQAYEGEGEHTAFVRQLIWREFAYYLLYHNPDLPERNLQSQFDAFPWQWESDFLLAWQHGQTGYPLVDAGMRELWQTGYMHNRIRMIVASFLVKNLMIHWQQGQAWFEACLFDADLANNSVGWQWVAGSGADAAPFFRVFNPVLQTKKFDPSGTYIRRYVPELSALPHQYIAAPWLAPESVLHEAGVELGKNYPKPIVDVKLSREQALEAYQQMKSMQ